MNRPGNHFLKKAPFVKILASFAAGILVQWYLEPPASMIWIVMVPAIFITIALFFFPLVARFRFSFLSGIPVALIFLSTGAWLARQKDIRNDYRWLGKWYRENPALVVTLDEPPEEKTNSFKADASARYLVSGNSLVTVRGKIILYFRKKIKEDPEDSAFLHLKNGSTILFRKPLQEIPANSNPGGFDYKRFQLFRGITHQVFLDPADFEILPGLQVPILEKIIFRVREKVIRILRKNIPGEKEAGLAEALLIGYKNDLDQSLVKAYSRTGVVHIIAISGLHLGIVYWLLLLLLKPMRKTGWMKWSRAFLVVSGLWAFSLLAGAQPSVLRSALMFSFLVLGEATGRRTFILNSMAASAFLLLCINPYWLWDIGFQLSYAAVLSIVIFMRPIYNLFYFKNKVLDFTWKLNAVTLAAQVLTMPLSIYHFHQVPTLFIFTNLLAVPLSSLILLGEILLCFISVFPFFAAATGKILGLLIRLMNTFIERTEAIPFSRLEGLQISIPQVILLILLAAGISSWLMDRSGSGLRWGLAALAGFVFLRSWSFMQCSSQHKIIVYNLPRKRAMDFIDGRKCRFIGDSDLLLPDPYRNFPMQPARIFFRVSPSDALQGFWKKDHLIRYRGENILLVDSAISFRSTTIKPRIDLLLISKNPAIRLPGLAGALDIKQVVLDGSVPEWKARYLKRDCDSLQIPLFDVATNGAFVMNLR